MKCLALSCGSGVFQEADTVYVVHVGGNGLAVARFVAALVAGISCVVGIGFLAAVSVVGGFIVLGVTALAVYLFKLFGKMRARLYTRPPYTMPRYVTLHLGSNEVRDYEGTLLGPLTEARLELVFQATSSAKALALIVANTKLVIARGNPFAGDVGPILQALVGVGVQPPS